MKLAFERAQILASEYDAGGTTIAELALELKAGATSSCSGWRAG
jgi:hypothetical protein